MREHRPPEGARRRPRLASPRVSALANAVIAVASPAYQRFVLKLRDVEFRHPERLLDALAAFEAGSRRLILAFRHPYGDEPQVLARAFLKYLPREARRSGKSREGAYYGMWTFMAKFGAAFSGGCLRSSWASRDSGRTRPRDRRRSSPCASSSGPSRPSSSSWPRSSSSVIRSTRRAARRIQSRKRNVRT